MGRNFVVYGSTVGSNEMKYSASTPMSAAKQAANDLFANDNKKKRKICFCMQDISSKKTYDYIALRKKLSSKKYEISVEKDDKTGKAKKPSRRSKRSGGGDRNFVLITDIGRDIDDTLALIALLHQHKEQKINLKAIVVAGYALDKREKLIYYWLRKFGINELSDDRKIPVFITPGIWQTTAENDLICIYPDDMPDDDVLYDFMDDYKDKTLSRLLNTHLEHDTKYTCNTDEIFNNFIQKTDNLEILCIANITWVNHLLQARILSKSNIQQKIKKIYIQGAYHVTGKDASGQDILEPLDYNMSLDKNAATLVINELKSIIPFTFLGKYTAYLIKFHNEEFNEFDNTFGINLKSQAIFGLFKLYVTNKAIFDRVFESDIKSADVLSTLEKDKNTLTLLYKSKPFNHKHPIIIDFVNALYKISNAYDLILVYLALNEEQFNFDYTYDGSNEYPAKYPNVSLIPFKKTYGNITHYQFNVSDDNVFKSRTADGMKDELKTFVLNGVVSMKNQSRFNSVQLQTSSKINSSRSNKSI